MQSLASAERSGWGQRMIHRSLRQTAAKAASSVQAESGETLDFNELDHKLQKLFDRCEHVLLTEFIECAVPLFYALYVIILSRLPNTTFYPETEHLDTAQLWKTVQNAVLYALLECASLLYMYLLLSWKLRISELHMLAFVLERDAIMLQSVFMSWVIICTPIHSSTER